MKLKISNFGYPCLNLFKDGKTFHCRAHPRCKSVRSESRRQAGRSP